MPLRSERWGVTGSPPKHHALRHWWWGDPLNGVDLSLYDGDGLTVARIVLVGSTYELRSPITWPRKAWPNLETAKRGAESIALASLPPDKATQRRIERDNERARLPVVRKHEAYRESKIWEQRWRPWTLAERSLASGKAGNDPGLPEFLIRAQP